MPGFDQTALMLYARGLSTRELHAFLEERYQVPGSTDLFSTITCELLGFRIAQTEGAAFWHRVVRELQGRSATETS